jgi:RNA-directed DNA polymerase
MTKSFEIPKALVWKAFQRVKANGGSSGVDGESIEAFERNLSGNLYKIWNRMVSGSYFPPPVKSVPIPKRTGGTRILGVPTVADRIAQTAVKMVLEPLLEPVFDDNSFGYRPGRSALDAVELVRRRSWKYDWVVEFDVKALFDAIDHGWLVKFVEHRIADRRVVRLIQKWLNAGVLEDGKRMLVGEGTPQGGSASPLLANIYLHYAFDLWVQAWRRKQASGDVIVVRFADDIAIGFQNESDAKRFWTELRSREIII